jgi:hypothetical protein
MPQRYIEGQKAGRLLVIGFLLIILLLFADGFAGLCGGAIH